MALAARHGLATVRFYRWDRPTVSFGRNEPAATRYRGLADRGHAVVRRPSGGRAVLHDRELTYAVVVPRVPGVRLRTLYRVIQEGLLGGLSALGVNADAAPSSPPVMPDAGPCFARPAAGEIVVRGRKLVGSAQARIEGALLQHGSLLIVNDQSGLGPGGLEAEEGRVTTLEDELAAVPPWSEIVAALSGGLSALLGVAMPARELTEPELAAENSIQARYRSAAWTWRR